MWAMGKLFGFCHQTKQAQIQVEPLAMEQRIDYIIFIMRHVILHITFPVYHSALSPSPPPSPSSPLIPPTPPSSSSLSSLLLN